MRRKGITIATLALLAIVAATANAEPVQSMAMTFKMSRHGAFKAKLTSRYYDTEGGKPPSPTLFKMRLQNGIRINRSKFPVCKADKLRETAGKGCDKSAKIGSGTAVVDLRPLFDTMLKAKVSLYNGPKPKERNGVVTLVIAGEADLGGGLTSVQVFEAKFLKERVGHYGIVLDLPAFIEPFKGVKVSIPEIKTTVGKLITKRKRITKRINGTRRRVVEKTKYNWVEPPRKCSGKWYFKSELTYEDGRNWEKEIGVPCKGLIRR